MKIQLSDLDQDLHLTITGEESWLERIYSDFLVPSSSAPTSGQTKPLVTGQLHIIKEEAGTVQVTGKLSYAPLLACARCSCEIPWPLDLKLAVRFLPEEMQDTRRKEKTLTADELDAYFVEQDAVDIEGLINDAIQTAIPTQPIAATDDGSACRICHADLEHDQVYGKPATQGGAPASPFEVLKGLKLKN